MTTIIYTIKNELSVTFVSLQLIVYQQSQPLIILPPPGPTRKCLTWSDLHWLYTVKRNVNTFFIFFSPTPVLAPVCNHTQYFPYIKHSRHNYLLLFISHFVSNSESGPP
jgi:hypothetical protein